MSSWFGDAWDWVSSAFGGDDASSTSTIADAATKVADNDGFNWGGLISSVAPSLISTYGASELQKAEQEQSNTISPYQQAQIDMEKQRIALQEKALAQQGGAAGAMAAIAKKRLLLDQYNQQMAARQAAATGVSSSLDTLGQNLQRPFAMVTK